MEDYYDLLGVARDASTADIKQTYRERIKEEHPDVSDNEQASDRTKELIRAKEVLTDDDERRRYDRIGHEAYVSTDGATETQGTADADSTASTDQSTEQASQNATAGSQTAGGGSQPSGKSGDSADTASSGTGAGASSTGTGAGASSAGTSTGASSTGTAAGASSTGSNTQQRYGSGTSWYDSSPSETEEDVGSGSPAWDPRRTYEISRESGNLQATDIFSSQRSIVLFLSTFFVYPVLLFGSLSSQFPTAVNLVVIACTILVIAFLQSVPTVGMVVFGTWTFLLPPVLVFVVGVNPLSLYGVLAMVGVGFPFGLSALTWIAIRPMSIT